MLKINLNDEIWTGIDVERKDKKGNVTSREFQRIAITTNKDDFILVAQYIIDGCSDISRLVIIHKPTDYVIRFDGLIKTIGLKSKRYSFGRV